MKHPHTLSGLSFLNTRPEHQAPLLTQLIQQRGGRVFHFPVTEIKPITFSTHSVKGIDFCIFLSSNAVHHFFQQCSDISILPKSIIAIGPATKHALTQQGILNAITPDQFHSESLLKLPILQHITRKNFLIICGENPKPLLQRTLRKRGAHVTILTCYQRVLLSHQMSVEFSHLLRSSIQWVISTSLGNLNNLIQQFTHPAHFQWLLLRKICIISASMKKHAKFLGFQEVVQAENPTPTAIINAIETNLLVNTK